MSESEGESRDLDRDPKLIQEAVTEVTKQEHEAEIEAAELDALAADLGVPPHAMVILMANERQDWAKNYHQLRIRQMTCEMTAKQHEKSNPTQSQQFQQQAVVLWVNMRHSLRAIRNIDRECQEARAKMEEALQPKPN